MVVTGVASLAPASAQGLMQHVDMTSREMTSAEMTRADLEAALTAATPARPADFTGKRLVEADLSRASLKGSSVFAAQMQKGDA